MSSTPSAASHAPSYVRVLTIAGSDSGGGAGIQADLKTFAALGCFGMSAIAAITAQNTRGVSAIHSVPANILSAQIDAVLDDIGADAIKIGMMGAVETVQAVAHSLKRHAHIPVVLDPVMVATSGDRLISQDTAAAIVAQLFPLATLVTPNLDEAAWLSGHTIANTQAMHEAAGQLRRMGAAAVLVKGGHLSGDVVSDLLCVADRAPLMLQSERIATRNGHGTGCTLSSAIAAHLAQGLELEAAVRAAREYILGAIAAGANVVTGAGTGPLNHGFAPRAQIMRTALNQATHAHALTSA